MDKSELQSAVNDSGFPLQLGLKLLANTIHWRIQLSEHPWQDPPSNNEKFIDLVLNGRRPETGGDGFQTLVIECKRARDTAWIFLRTESDSRHDARLITRARVVARREGIPSPLINDWADVPCLPGSPIAEFCVIRKERRDGQVELLERTAAEIVRATDALAHEELTIYGARNAALHRVYTPMIVTTAKLYICDADYREVDFDTGEIGDSTIKEIPFLRFTKSLSAGRVTRSTATLEDVSTQSERSVIVVQAGSFPNFLEQWELGNLSGELAAALLT